MSSENSSTLNRMVGENRGERRERNTPSPRTTSQQNPQQPQQAHHNRPYHHQRQQQPRTPRFNRNGGDSSSFSGGFGGGGGGDSGRNRVYHHNQQHSRSWRQSGGRNGRPFKRTAKQRSDHAGVPMTGRVSDCLICCQHSDIFAIGECMHPVCMECALRIRVVGDSRQCPQCRAEIPTLHFICAPPGILRIPTQTEPHPDERKFGVKFETPYVVDCFNAYMANRCVECLKKGEKIDFPAFAELRSHMTQVHQLSFCHICCDNLNVLTKDRKVYTRNQLQQHMDGRLRGEEDGFQGHPTCHFCEQRFYDDEQQYRHLRKDHYFCQFCDQDGLEQNVFYKDQYRLNQHNRRAHHPCTDPECLPVGIVFRTDTELDVHRAKSHRSGGGTGTRSGAIPLDIQFSRSGYTRLGGQSSSRAEAAERDENVAEGQRFIEPPVISRIVPSAQHQQKQTRIIHSSSGPSVASANEFPTLPIPTPPVPYGALPGWTPPQPRLQMPFSTSQKLPLQSRDQFPTLSGGPTSSGSPNAQQNGVWANKATKELFKQPVAIPKKEEPKRPKFIPSPECWPEGMREQLKAREQGLPDPDPILPPSWFNPPKKEKKKKSKTVPISQMLANKIAAESAKLASSTGSSTKFSTLAELGDSIEKGAANMAEVVKKKNGGGKGKNKAESWWKDGEEGSSSKSASQQMMKLTPSESGDPGFVRIHLVRREAGREEVKKVNGKEKIEEEEEEKEEESEEEKEDEKEEKEEKEGTKEEKGDDTFFRNSITTASATTAVSLEPPPGFQQKAPPGFAEPILPKKSVDDVSKKEEDIDKNDENVGQQTSSSAVGDTSTGSNHWPLTMQSIASALFGGGSKEEKTDGGTGKS